MNQEVTLTEDVVFSKEHRADWIAGVPEAAPSVFLALTRHSWEPGVLSEWGNNESPQKQ